MQKLTNGSESEGYRRVLDRYTEFDRRGGWIRRLINVTALLFVLIAIVAVSLLYSATDAYVVGAFLALAAQVCVWTMLVLAVTALLVGCRHWEFLPPPQRILAAAPIFLWLAALICWNAR